VLHECDLALLTVTEDNSFEDIIPMQLSEPDILPTLREKVHVLGFPVGGDEVSITEGVVSRVEVQVRGVLLAHTHSRSPVRTRLLVWCPLGRRVLPMRLSECYGT
jgi:hypothetical protein